MNNIITKIIHGEEHRLVRCDHMMHKWLHKGVKFVKKGSDRLYTIDDLIGYGLGGIPVEFYAVPENIVMRYVTLAIIPELKEDERKISFNLTLGMIGDRIFGSPAGIEYWYVPSGYFQGEDKTPIPCPLSGSDKKEVTDFIDARTLYPEILLKDFRFPSKKVLNALYGERCTRTGGIKDVIFHSPATIVIWKDGTKTVVKTQDGEKYDPEKGLAMAICKKIMGNGYDYYDTFKHWLKKVKKEKK